MSELDAAASTEQARSLRIYDTLSGYWGRSYPNAEAAPDTPDARISAFIKSLLPEEATELVRWYEEMACGATPKRWSMTHRRLQHRILIKWRRHGLDRLR